MDPAIRLGLELSPLPGPADGTDRWAEAAAAAEEAGFGSVWVTGSAVDACTVAGGLVARTTSLTLGVESGVGGDDRNPAVLARDVTALDVVSAGRAAVLLRSEEGWERLTEAYQVCRRLFTEEAPSYQGRFFHLVEAANRPRPVRSGGPTLVVQGPPSSTPAAMAAGALEGADAWVVGGGPEDVAAWRRVVDGPALLWRGDLSPGADGDQLRRAGADGLIVRLPPSVAAVRSTGRALVARWAG